MKRRKHRGVRLAVINEFLDHRSQLDQERLHIQPATKEWVLGWVEKQRKAGRSAKEVESLILRNTDPPAIPEDVLAAAKKAGRKPLLPLPDTLLTQHLPAPQGC